MDNVNSSSPKKTGLTRSKSRIDVNSILTSSSHDLIELQKSIAIRRTGTVLSRKKILKTDHFFTGINMDLECLLLGAPNFRQTDLNIYGVAQPSTTGLSTVLSLLDCAPIIPDDQPHVTPSNSAKTCVWFSTREEPLVYVNEKPFVLREEESPFKNINMFTGISSERLEHLEVRLKQEILKEAARYHGLILVHEELEDGKIIPTWISTQCVRTPREVFEHYKKQGYGVTYHRFPLTANQSPSSAYMDKLVASLKNVSASQSVVFSCGMGVGRSKE
jgi:hypothetical protein